MEHFKSPFGASELIRPEAVVNQTFFREMLLRAQSHAFYSHAFMSLGDGAAPSPDTMSAILTSFYKIVSPFTGMLCALGGRAPNLRCRFALMDNIYEEMGCGHLDAAHPSLYLKMLASIGVDADEAERAPTLPSISRINQHLEEAILESPFAVACAVLASAEAGIPPSFPVLSAMAKSAFPDVDLAFFDRHGPRDEGHSNNAAMLFALSADSSQFEIVEAAVTRDLDFRRQLFDEWMETIDAGATPSCSVQAY